MTRLDERFADWVDGRLRPTERDALEAELAKDPTLQREAENYRRTVQLLRGALAPEEMGVSIADSVMAEVGEVARRPLDSRPPRNWRPFLASLVAAAAFILVFAVLRLIPPAPSGAVQELAKADDDEDLVAVKAVEEAAEDGASGGFQDAPKDRGQPASAPATAAEQKPAVHIILPGGTVASSRRPAAEGEAPAAEGARADESQLRELAERADQADKSAAPAGVAPTDSASGAPLGEEQKKLESTRKTEDPPARSQPAESSPERSEALLRDELGLGDLALIVRFDAAVAARVRADLERRPVSLSAAEVLAVFAPPVEGDTRGGGGAAVDLRGIPVQMLDRPGDRLGAAEPRPGDRGDAELLSWDDLAATDRVLLLSGTGDQLRSFTAVLRARLSPAGALSVRRVSGSLTGVVGDAARARLAGASPPRPGGGRAAPDPIGPPTGGPATPGPTGRTRGVADENAKRAAPGSDRLSLFLVLRFPQ